MIDRVYVSRWSSPTFAVIIHKAGQPTDADSGVAVSMVDDAAEGTVLVFEDRAATRDADGAYSVVLTSSDTEQPGVYTLVWEWEWDGEEFSRESYIEVGQHAPVYDSLDEDMKELVESVWRKFADLYDSPYGGPHLQVYFQTNFGRNRMAQLLYDTVEHINSMVPGERPYGLSAEGGSKFPSRWYGFLSEQLYVETLKHLRRSYVEQPTDKGVGLALLDRRDYMNRWGEILREAEEDVAKMLDQYKMFRYNLGQTRLTVSGGAFGRYGPQRYPGAAQPRFHWRFY
jgi:hypothetical protein